MFYFRINRMLNLPPLCLYLRLFGNQFLGSFQNKKQDIYIYSKTFWRVKGQISGDGFLIKVSSTTLHIMYTSQLIYKSADNAITACKK